MIYQMQYTYRVTHCMCETVGLSLCSCEEIFAPTMQRHATLFQVKVSAVIIICYSKKGYSLFT